MAVAECRGVAWRREGGVGQLLLVLARPGGVLVEHWKGVDGVVEAGRRSVGVGGAGFGGGLWVVAGLWEGGRGVDWHFVVCFGLVHSWPGLYFDYYRP